MRPHSIKARLAMTSALAAVATVMSPAYAQDQSETGEVETIVVTGSLIERTELTATSPVSTFGEAQIELDRAVTVEDITSKLPQFAGGVNSTQTGSDGRGAQTLDLRNLGQNRTLVLINGTRAVPFSFRNAVDVNAIPAPLLKQVDVLTGGAAAVYGADAVAGVVNFIIDTEFEGIEVGASLESADGLNTSSASITLGGQLGDKGHIVAFGSFSDRGDLRVGERDWADENTAAALPGLGGNFTDVASGNTFSFDEAGNFTTEEQFSDLTDQNLLVQPLERINLSSFFQYEFAPQAELYGRVMYTEVDTQGAGRAGQNPIVVNEEVTITEDNAFLPPEAAALLTFVDGEAQVNVNRTLGELGILRADTNRITTQYQAGLRGDFTDWLSYDAYIQYGKVDEETTTTGDALRVNGAGDSRFAAIANTVDIFGPGADLDGFGRSFTQELREREQTVAAVVLKGDSSPVFSLPAGPISFAVGYEYRDESLVTGDEAALTNGLTFRGSTGGVIVGEFDVTEYYGEILVPLLSDLPFVQNLTLEAALRSSDYSNTDAADTDKLGLSWTVNDSVRFRGTTQSVIRAPNIGEFAAPIFSIPFSLLRTVPRLQPRYLGDPCALGTGDPDQCAAFGAPPVGSYDSLDPANLTGDYFFGGNPDIKPEEGETFTIGAVITPEAVPGLDIIVDYYNIEITDAVGQIQPVDALQSCYIDNPSPGNPICAAIARDPETGFIGDAFVNDRNLGTIKQEGVDVDISYGFDLPANFIADTLSLSYQSTFVTEYTIQRNPVLDPVDCAGTFGFACSSDAVSLVQPDYRHRTAAELGSELGALQLVWRRIGEVSDAAGSGETIDAVDYLDLNARWDTPFTGFTVAAGLRNALDEEPPLPEASGAFGTYPGTYDVVGRTFGMSLTYRK